MKPALLVVVLLTLAAAAAYADPIDPGIIIGGGVGSFSVTGTPFSFADADGSGSGTNCVFFGPGSPQNVSDHCIFVNNSGVVWNTLTFFVTSDVGLTIECGFGLGHFFASCTKTPPPSGGNVYRFDFFGGNPWPVGGSEEIIITGFGQWPDNTTFQAIANIPEPATMLLTATGLASVFLRRRLRKRAG